MYKSIIVLGLFFACVFAETFTPATPPCGVTITAYTDDGRSLNVSFLSNKMYRFIGDIKGRSPTFYLYRTDIKTRDDDVLFVEIKDYDELNHNGSSCESRLISTQQFKNEIDLELAVFYKPIKFVKSIAAPEICYGCRKYCLKEGDCANATDGQYFVADGEDRIVVTFTDDKLTIVYGDEPRLSDFAVDNLACSDKYGIPEKNPCPSTFTPAPLPCGFTFSAFTDDGKSLNVSVLGTGLYKFVSNVKDDKPTLYLFRTDITNEVNDSESDKSKSSSDESESYDSQSLESDSDSDDSSDDNSGTKSGKSIRDNDDDDKNDGFLYVKIEGYDEVNDTGSSCEFRFISEKKLEDKLYSKLKHFLKPVKYYNTTDDPQTCTGCVKYCLEEGDCEHAREGEYVVVDSEGHIVVTFDEDKKHKVIYGPSPVLDDFALDNFACSEKYEAPKDSECPVPSPSSSSSSSKSSSSKSEYLSSASKAYINGLIFVIALIFFISSL